MDTTAAVASGEPGEERHEHALTLRQVFLERAISVSTMDRTLQGITAVALLAIAAAAVLVALRDNGLSAVPLGSEGGAQTTMPAVTFWLAVVLFSAAWTYVIGGLLHAHRLARLATLGIFAYGTWQLWSTPLPHLAWRMAPSYALFAAICVIGLASLYEPPAECGDVRRLRLALLPLLFVLVLALELAFWWRLRPLGDRRFYTLAFFHQLEVCSFALIPVLLIVGVDFAEWGDAVATRATAIARRTHPERAVPALAAIAAAGVLAYRLAEGDPRGLVRGAAMAAVFAVLLAAATRAVQPGARRVPYATIFVSSLALMGMVLGIAYSSNAGAPTTLSYTHAQAPRFGLSYPTTWAAEELPPRVGITFVVFTAPAAAAQLNAIRVPAAVLKIVPDPLAVFYKGTVGSTAKDGPWRRVDFRQANGKEGVAWERTDANGMWLLVGISSQKLFASFQPDFAATKDSWTTKPAGSDASAPATESRYTAADRAIEGSALGWLGLAAVAATLLPALRRRRLPGWVSASLLFVVAAGLYYALVQLPTLSYTLFGASSRSAWPQLTLRGLETVVAAATLLALSTRRGRRAAGALVGINLGLFAVYWLDRAISGGISAGRMSIVQAVLVLVALVWDVVMSGETVTNRHNRRFPRHARVLVYLGYIMAVAAAVLFFSSIRTPTGAAEPLFESEGFADTGLLFLGTTLLVTLFALRVGRGRTTRA